MQLDWNEIVIFPFSLKLRGHYFPLFLKSREYETVSRFFLNSSSQFPLATFFCILPFLNVLSVCGFLHTMLGLGYTKKTEAEH